MRRIHCMDTCHRGYAWLPLGFAITLLEPAAAEAPVARHLDFTVLLDNRAIGTHTFALNTLPDGGMEIESAAEFRVTALGIPFYSYQHHDREEWREGCLHQITATTNDNGERFEVSGSTQADGLRVTTRTGRRVLPGCVHTFAYWDRRDIFGARQLLNAQSGNYEPVTVRTEGNETLVSAGRAVTAERLRISSSHADIELWYSSEGEWLALQTQTSGGRTLRYEIRH
jgi:hypothetical protein